jgi:superoxide dismutase
MVVPTDVIDIYEHAFYVDYQNRKTDYVEKLIDIRWFDGTC